MKKYKLNAILLSICLFVSGCNEGIYDLLSNTEIESDIENETETIPTTVEDWIKTPNYVHGGYYYDHINDTQKAAYEHIYKTMIYEDAEKLFCPTSKEDIRIAYESILYDHPEIYYCNGFTLSSYILNDKSSVTEFSPNFNKTVDEISLDQKKINSKVSAILAKIPYEWTEYEKAQYLYEYIVQNTTYQVGSQDEENIVSVFNHGYSVCEGYSKAYKYLCDKLDIECIVVTGLINSSGTAHMWNEINIDGKWYFIDVTWGDTDFKNAEGTPEVRYDYLCVTTDRLLNSHTIDDFVNIPECTDIEDNYYYKNGLYLSTFDTDKIEELLRPLDKYNKITVMCADDLIYDEMYKYLIEDLWIFKYFPDVTNIKYSTNGGTLTYTFWISEE